MIQCPQCKATLPDWAKECQFCNADTSSVARSAGADPGRNVHAFEAPKWIWGAYYGLAGYYVLNGAWGMIQGALMLSSAQDKLVMSAFPFILIAVGFIGLVLGLGLIVRNETVRGIMNFFCGVKILLGLLGLAGSIFSALFTGPLGIFLMFLNVLDIAVAGFMIYMIGETDKYSFR